MIRCDRSDSCEMFQLDSPTKGNKGATIVRYDLDDLLRHRKYNWRCHAVADYRKRYSTVTFPYVPECLERFTREHNEGTWPMGRSPFSLKGSSYREHRVMIEYQPPTSR